MFREFPKSKRLKLNITETEGWRSGRFEMGDKLETCGDPA
jgi:hypothetical protein